jgi:hypothetical protein
MRAIRWNVRVSSPSARPKQLCKKLRRSYHAAGAFVYSCFQPSLTRQRQAVAPWQ